jgi:hypothetical protein
MAVHIYIPTVCMSSFLSTSYPTLTFHLSATLQKHFSLIQTLCLFFFSCLYFWGHDRDYLVVLEL